MIPKELLKDTGGNAVGFATYGGPGLEKTRAGRTLPPPIKMYDFEKGAGGVAPWIRRFRNLAESTWTEVSQEEREHAFSLVLEDFRTRETTQPAPLIDVVKVDVMEYTSYSLFVEELGNFDRRAYNSLQIDAALEFSQMTQTFSKGEGREYEEMQLKQWGGAQERASIQVRRIRELRDSGIFIYITGGEDMDKDYVQDPRSMKLAPGEAPQPYAIKGSIQLPGKLVGVVTHAVDNLFHAKTLNGETRWVSSREPISGEAYWEAKDRWGRLDKYCRPNFFAIMAQIYGKDNARVIYQQAREVSNLA